MICGQCHLKKSIFVLLIFWQKISILKNLLGAEWKYLTNFNTKKNIFQEWEENKDISRSKKSLLLIDPNKSKL